MKSLVAALLLAGFADGIRPKWKQDNKSVSHVDSWERDEKMLVERKNETRKRDNSSASLVAHVRGDGKLLEAKEATMPNENFTINAPLQQDIGPHPPPDSLQPALGMYTAAVVIIAALAIICCACCFIMELQVRLQSDKEADNTVNSDKEATFGKTHSATQRSKYQRKATTRTLIDDQLVPVYLTYWDLDGEDAKRPWNPSEQGGTDGVQLAIVKGGEVRRIPTDGICTQYNSVMHKSKEWHSLHTPSIDVVNYSFDAIPSIHTVSQYWEQHGLKQLELRRTFWGNHTLAVGAVFEAFHRTSRASKRHSGSASLRHTVAYGEWSK